MKFSVAIALTLISLTGPVSPILAQSVPVRPFSLPQLPAGETAPSRLLGGGAARGTISSNVPSGQPRQNAHQRTTSSSGSLPSRLYSTIRFAPPDLPDGIHTPTGRPRGGASRGQCPNVSQPLTALVPTVAQPNRPSRGSAQTVWGLTVAERPTFWFYVPYTLNPEVGLEFVLLDDNDNEIYKAELDATTPSPGIVSVTLPPSAKALDVGKMYHWYFMVYCAGENSVFTEGAVQRVAPPPALVHVDQLTPREQAAAYADNGIWFDAMTVIATLHREHPNDGAIAADWAALLRSANLSDVARQPFVECCTPEEQ